MPRININIDELSRLAGVSKTTVSRVINNKPDVHPATRERILGLIDEYGFQPNAFAKAISLQKSQHIGLIIPHKAEYVFSNPFYTEVMRGVSTEIDAQDYYLLICYAHEHNYMDIYRQKRVDGFVLLSPGSYHANIIQTLNAENVPFVSTARISDQETMISVDIDNYNGAVLAVEHLLGLGHCRIAYVGKPTLKSSQDRLDGYRATLAAHCIDIDPRLALTTETSSVESGQQAADLLLNMDPPPTAIFFANDVMALGGIKAIQERGLRVPEDVSVVGFDDIPLASFITPPLTTIWQPAYQKGVEAARQLIHMLETGLNPSSVTLNVELVVRRSTGPARPAA